MVVTNADNDFVKESHCVTDEGNGTAWLMEIPREEDSAETKELFLTQPSEIWRCCGINAQYVVVKGIKRCKGG